jgi:hypothetical protein
MASKFIEGHIRSLLGLNPKFSWKYFLLKFKEKGEGLRNIQIQVDEIILP